MRKVFILIFSIAIFASSCEYQKLLKSNDSELKYTKAKQYYEEKDYARAMTLFEQLINVYRGTEKGEEILYLFAYCNYYQRDYIMAGHYFRRFAGSFPNSEHAEESSYMSAYCYYLDAPKSTLDQETTRKAIKEFQLFVGMFPKSERIADANELIDELNARLAKKSYENAMLYYKVGYYKAAVVALKSSLKEHPDSKYREDILYHVIKANYKYATLSIESKTKERYEQTIKAYKTFIKSYPNSKYSKEVTKIHDSSYKRLENI